MDVFSLYQLYVKYVSGYHICKNRTGIWITVSDIWGIPTDPKWKYLFNTTGGNSQDSNEI